MADDIMIRLRAKGEQLTQDVRQSMAGVEGEVERSGRASGERMGRGLAAGLKIGMAAVGAIAATVGVAIRESFEGAASIDKLSKQLGVGVEALQLYRYAARSSGADVDALEGSIGNLASRIGQARAGNRDAIGDFRSLGVELNTTSGFARNNEEVFSAVINRLGQIPEPAQRAALGARLLGDEYQAMAPLVTAAAGNLDNLTESMRRQFGILTQEDVDKLNRANREWGNLQQSLAVDISGAVARNSDGLSMLAQRIGSLTAQAIDGAAALGRFWDRMANEPIITMRSSNADSLNMNQFLPQGYSHRQWLEQWRGGNRLYSVGGRTIADDAIWGDKSRQRRGTAAPIVPRGGGSTGRGSGGGRSGGGGSSGQSAEDRERERAAKARLETLRQADDVISRELALQNDLQRIEAVRAEQGDAAAETLKRQLDYLRQHPAAAAQTVEEMAQILGLQGPISDAERQRLQTMIDQYGVILRQNEASAEAVEIDRKRKEVADNLRAKQESAARAAEEEVEAARQRAEDQMRDLSDFYYGIFSGRAGDIWKNFKEQGMSVLADLAARWTLAKLSGQSFDAGGALGGIINGGGGMGGGAGGLFSTIMGGLFGGKGGGSMTDIGTILEKSSAAAGTGAAKALVETTRGATSGAGGLLGGLGGAMPWIGVGLAALPLVTNLLGKVFGGTKKGSATLGYDAGELTVGSVTGNSGSRKKAASGALGNVIDGLDRIAETLGGTITGAGSVSIGMRKGNWRVDPTGRGATKVKKGAIDFGEDQEAAIRYAIGEALRDGVIGGISDASKRIMQAAGDDLETALAKALSIEEIPKKLKARLDPLGAALDEVDAKYAKLAATLKEGGASAEQVAQARQLWELERADAVKQIGDASQTLKDFIKALVVGNDSPLSLRRQTEEAEKALAPYEAQMAALVAGKAQVDSLRASGADASKIAEAEAAQKARADAFDQSGFTEISDQFLNLKRNTDASTQGYFDAWTRIKGLAEQAVGLIDATVPKTGDAKDPFAELTAKATQNTVAILDGQTSVLNAINDNIARLLGSGGFAGAAAGYIYEHRNFV